MKKFILLFISILTLTTSFTTVPTNDKKSDWVYNLKKPSETPTIVFAQLGNPCDGYFYYSITFNSYPTDRTVTVKTVTTGNPGPFPSMRVTRVFTGGVLAGTTYLNSLYPGYYCGQTLVSVTFNIN